jgi:hypothetical protein
MTSSFAATLPGRDGFLLLLQQQMWSDTNEQPMRLLAYEPARPGLA